MTPETKEQNAGTMTPPEPQERVLALGNFDGVHLGHRAVIEAALEEGRQRGLSVSVLTLEPHPREMFSAPLGPFRLTPASVKNRLLMALGVDEIITLNFSPELASQPAQDFVEQTLAQHYGARHVAAGADFVFGYRRSGTMHDMRHWLVAYGIGVTEVPLSRDETGEIISSTRIRDAISKGNLALARTLLGRPWAITGIVERGAKKGSSIGIPTANMPLGEHLRPPFGVYAVMARRVGGKEAFPGVANIGVRPTVDGVHELLEFHLFQPQSGLYDQEWEVELHDFLRPEEKFSDLNALRDQILKDIATAKEFLASRQA